MSYLSNEVCNDQSCRRPAKIRIPRQRADHQVCCRIITLKMQNIKLGALIKCGLKGRPKNPHFQNEAKCTSFPIKMSSICVRMINHFQSNAEHLTSFCYRDLGELGNGLFVVGQLCYLLASLVKEGWGARYVWFRTSLYHLDKKSGILANSSTTQISYPSGISVYDERLLVYHSFN